MSDMQLPAATRPSLDLQTHLEKLEEAGLLVRIDHPINKDTELHPLVRCQFLGGIHENDRRAFLFTNVVDSDGRHYDIPVVVGALAASPNIYAIGMGRPVEEIGADWLHAIDHPIPPIVVDSPRCRRSSSPGTNCAHREVALQGCRFRSLRRVSMQRPI